MSPAAASARVMDSIGSMNNNDNHQQQQHPHLSQRDQHPHHHHHYHHHHHPHHPLNNQVSSSSSSQNETIRASPPSKSAIIDFYQNRSVLITGASGFIGKVLIEKLLRTCPGLRRIFVLIRPKWNKRPSERLAELLDSPLFDGVRRQGCQLDERVLVVEGDVTQLNLGLSEQNLIRIMNEVSVIYHSAATVKFDEPLKQSIAINIAGTKNMIELCRKIPQLAALVHVSTAYANCDRDQIDEHIYPVPGQLVPEKLIELANWLDQDTLQELKGRLLEARPNTYTYTKAMAEWLLVKSARDLPVVICRPSIVVASQREPFAGWIDNCNGPTGIILGTGKGLIRTMLARKECVADLVPCDSVINLMITLGWFAHVYRNHKRPNDSLAESLAGSLMGSDSASADAESLEDSELPIGGAVGGDGDGASGRAKDGAGRRRLVADGNANNNNNNNNNHSGPDFMHATSEMMNGNTGQRATREAQSIPDLYQPAKGAGGLGDATLEAKLNHLDEGYGTQSPYPRSPSSTTSSSSSSSSSCSVGAGQVEAPAPANNLADQSGGQLDQPDQPEDECKSRDDNAAAAAAAALIENQTFQSFVNQRRLAEQEHAAFEYKLKQFRHSAQMKLAAKELPEELADIPVFHCTTGAENPITWGRVQVLTVAALALYPSLNIFRYPNGRFTSSQRLNYFYHLTLHLIPAYMVDLFAKLFGGKNNNKPSMVRIFRKVEQARDVFKAFTLKGWKFCPDNRLMLYNELLSDEDRLLFSCDLASIDWVDFFNNYAHGVRKFILKEPDETLEAARINMKFVYFRNTGIQILFIAMIAYYFLGSRLTF